MFKSILTENLAIKPNVLQSIPALQDGFKVSERVEEKILSSENEDSMWDYFGNKVSFYSVENGVATIDLKGVVSRGYGSLGQYYGFADIELFSKNIRRAKEDPSVSKVVINIDSPGGTVIGTRDAANAVSELANEKEVYSFTSGLMCSAAYYVASPSKAIYSTESSIVGSVGVYTVYIDNSEMLKDWGIELKVFRSGKFKASGVDTLTEEQSELIQNEVDGLGKEFRSFVKSNRQMISDDDLEGQSFSGTEAASKYLVAGNTGSLQDLIKKIG